MKNILLVVLCILCCCCNRDEYISTPSDIKISKSAFAKINAECPHVVTTYSENDADYVVDKKEDLQSTINAASPGDIIYVKDDAVFEFDETDCNYLTRDCYGNGSSECAFVIIDRPIKLVSGGASGSYGATFTTPARILPERSRKLIRIESDNVTISGIKILGNDFMTNIEDIDHLPQKEIDTSYNAYTPGVTDGILICGYNNLTVENCEISGWSQAGIHLKNSTGHKIINNYIHHNIRYGLGYGVSFNTTETATTDGLVSCNSFEYNRHDIAGSGHENESYEASYNIVGYGGQPSWTYSFDMHGKAEYDSLCPDKRAGNTIEIHHNKFNNRLIPAFRIRGIPVGEVYIHNNSFAQENECDAIKQSVCTHLQSEFINLRIENNTYASDELGITNNFLYLNQADKIIKFSGNVSCETAIGEISRGWSNYSRFLVGNWRNDGNDDLIAYHEGLNELHLYKFKYDGSGFYSGYDEVSSGWTNYSEFLVGNWSNNGTDDLIAYHKGLDELHFYKFRYDGTGFYSGYDVVSSGWTNYSEFLVGNWSNNGTDDLIAYHKGLDELHFYKFRYDGTGFYSGYDVVSSGWTNYSEFLVGNWSNNGTDDLIAYHKGLDELHFYKFRYDGTGFYSGYDVVSSGWTNYSEFLVGNWSNNGTDDLIAYHKGLDELHFYKFRYDGTGFYSGYDVVSSGWSNYTHFAVGNWSNNGTDDLIAYHKGLKELHLYKFRYDGTGFYSGYDVLASNMGSFTQFFANDINQNGRDDLIGITETNEFYLLVKDGNVVTNTYIGVFPDLKIFLNGNWN
ncbi:right-handed parallel beta-helix repeat-containing protein [Aquimarina sp. D1M17]|uniref:right-handed parallel beta-helix repeat-containing protein n=1 Tax=Aquimarina acroporae TaxID=2937283 RepID=UPI0020BD76FD|nr:right-handed parallel beta-helix repeat-containing protein [Aquimarina acroporae]MCK8523281.1 right-handed parallel beta-helix repeat-containing protein [Aquimarina acroporae]